MTAVGRAPETGADLMGGSVEGIRLSDQPELRIDFNRLIDTGLISANTANTWGFEIAANWRNFLIQGEYIGIDVNPTVGQGLDFGGWYVEGSWCLLARAGPRRFVGGSAGHLHRECPEPRGTRIDLV